MSFCALNLRLLSFPAEVAKTSNFWPDSYIMRLDLCQPWLPAIVSLVNAPSVAEHD